MIQILRPLLAPAARRALGDLFEPSAIDQLLNDAFDDYERRRQELPRIKQTGPRWMVRLAALTAAFYRSLLQHGVAEAEARRRIAQLTWLVYGKMAAVPWGFARVLSRRPDGRLKRATDLFRRFPFRAPSYDMVDVGAERDVVAFDVRRCPVAEYFQQQGLSELCVEAWCNLDVLLAEKWDARLERTGTLAQGSDRCDFRWRLVQIGKKAS